VQVQVKSEKEIGWGPIWFKPVVTLAASANSIYRLLLSRKWIQFWGVILFKFGAALTGRKEWNILISRIIEAGGKFEAVYDLPSFQFREYRGGLFARLALTHRDRDAIYRTVCYRVE